MNAEMIRITLKVKTGLRTGLDPEKPVYRRIFFETTKRMSNETCPDLRQATAIKGGETLQPYSGSNTMGKTIISTDITGCSVGSDCANRQSTGSGGEARKAKDGCGRIWEALCGTKAAESIDVKVIIKDLETKRYLSANGRWVTAERDAQDFVSILPAYNFAKNFMSRRFEVVLYCADDDYRATIITGEGTGSESFGDTMTAPKVAVISSKTIKAKKASQVCPWSHFNACMTSAQNHLN